MLRFYWSLSGYLLGCLQGVGRKMCSRHRLALRNGMGQLQWLALRSCGPGSSLLRRRTGLGREFSPASHWRPTWIWTRALRRRTCVLWCRSTARCSEATVIDCKIWTGSQPAYKSIPFNIWQNTKTASAASDSLNCPKVQNVLPKSFMSVIHHHNHSVYYQTIQRYRLRGRLWGLRPMLPKSDSRLQICGNFNDDLIWYLLISGPSQIRSNAQSILS